MANPTDTGPTLPGRPSYVYDHKADCFVGPKGTRVPADWVPAGRTISMLAFLYLLGRIEEREKGACNA